MANIANKNPLFQSTKDTFGNVKFTLNAYSAKDFLNLRTMVQYPINFQRYYLSQNSRKSNDRGANLSKLNNTENKYITQLSIIQLYII